MDKFVKKAPGSSNLSSWYQLLEEKEN